MPGVEGAGDLMADDQASNSGGDHGVDIAHGFELAQPGGEMAAERFGMLGIL
jgi:hypothetical protein